jgi:hypothetical protein
MGDIGDMNSILCARMSKASSENSGSSSPAYGKVAGLKSPMSPPISKCSGMNGLSAWGLGAEMTPHHVPQGPRALHPSSARKEVLVTTNNRRRRP